MTPEQKVEILDGAQDMTPATVREDGYPQATTVSFVHDGLATYFGCEQTSQKARNIKGSDKISLTANLPYASWQEIRGLSLGGRARFVTDTEEIDGVFEKMIAKFPQIKDYISGDEAQEKMCIVRIAPEIVSLLDYRKGFGHAEEISA